MDEVPSLIVGALLPAAWEIVTFLRHRRFDPVSALNLVALGMGIALAVTGGSARFILVKESFVTGAIGTAFLLSLLGPRPAHFYLGRQFVTGNVQERVDRYNAGWDISPKMRTVLRTTTSVWGVVMLLELALRIVLVFRLTTEQMLAAGPIVFYLTTGALVLWTIRYVRRHRPEIQAAIRAKS